MRKATLFVACLTALSGCSKLPANSVTLPTTLAQPCDPLPEFEGKTSDDLVGYDLRLIDLYKQCATRHAGVS